MTNYDTFSAGTFREPFLTSRAHAHGQSFPAEKYHSLSYSLSRPAQQAGLRYDKGCESRIIDYDKSGSAAPCLPPDWPQLEQGANVYKTRQ